MNKLQRVCSAWCEKAGCLTKSIWLSLCCLFRFLLLNSNPLWVQIFYFLSLSLFGFCFLRLLRPTTSTSSFDLFFTSVSATTVSSMSTVEMEVFSNSQLVILTFLMLAGGEVFTSMLGLLFIRLRLKTLNNNNISRNYPNPTTTDIVHQIEMGTVTRTTPELKLEVKDSSSEYLLSMSMILKYLSFVVLGYLVFVHVVGVAMVSVYVALISSAKERIERKGLKMFTFSVFTVVSTFASCGFVPTNENMIVFSKNSGLLLMLIPQVLLGNTLFPPFLRFLIWVLGKLFKQQKEPSEYLLKNTDKIGYKHLLPRQHSTLLVATVFGFIFVQFILFCFTDWNSEALEGLNSYQKVIGIIFQMVNSRHTGETIMDLSILSPPTLVLFAVMMYLPPYTSFVPMKGDEQNNGAYRGKRRGENLILSQLSYLVMFVIVICITERQKLKEDPLNFNVLNIVIEVISAYGNVGFTTGYSCKRQLRANGKCKDKWFGFVGRWSPKGKIILIVVMLFGRLKKFNMDGGKAWKLLNSLSAFVYYATPLHLINNILP